MVTVVGLLPVQSLAYHLCVASSRPALETQKGCTRLAIVRDKVCQLPAQGRWFSPGTPVSSTSKTDRHDIANLNMFSRYSWKTNFTHLCAKTRGKHLTVLRPRFKCDL